MEWCGIVQLGILVFQIIEHDAIGSAEGVDVRLPHWRAGELHMGACAIGAYIQPLLLQHGMCLHAPVLVAGTHHRMAQPHHHTTHSQSSAPVSSHPFNSHCEPACPTQPKLNPNRWLCHRVGVRCILEEGGREWAQIETRLTKRFRNACKEVSQWANPRWREWWSWWQWICYSWWWCKQLSSASSSSSSSLKLFVVFVSSCASSSGACVQLCCNVWPYLKAHPHMALPNDQSFFHKNRITLSRLWWVEALGYPECMYKKLLRRFLRRLVFSYVGFTHVRCFYLPSKWHAG